MQIRVHVLRERLLSPTKIDGLVECFIFENTAEQLRTIDLNLSWIEVRDFTADSSPFV